MSGIGIAARNSAGVRKVTPFCCLAIEPRSIFSRRKAWRNGSSRIESAMSPEISCGSRVRARPVCVRRSVLTSAMSLMVRFDEHGQIGRRLDEGARVRVDPDAEHALLAEGDDGLARAGHRHDDVVAAAPRDRLRVALDRAEQHHVGAGEVRRDQHARGRERGDQPLGLRRRGERQRDRGDGERDDPRALMAAPPSSAR